MRVASRAELFVFASGRGYRGKWEFFDRDSGVLLATFYPVTNYWTSGGSDGRGTWREAIDLALKRRDELQGRGPGSN